MTEQLPQLNELSSTPDQAASNGVDDFESKVVTGLWIGTELPPLAQLCIRSFQDNGFTFRLFTYEKVAKVPSGTQIQDASAILSRDDVFIHATGSLAHASDWFRYRFLAIHGGLWTDMDVVCLKPFPGEPIPWFALQEPEIAAIGFLAFPRNHIVPSLLAEFAFDPALQMPWDSARDIRRKASLRSQRSSVVDRRIHLPWSTTGPGEFTKAVKHFGLWDSAAKPQSIYPVHYYDWIRLFDGSLELVDSRFADSWAIHLWGDMLRREPSVFQQMSPASVVAILMDRHGIMNSTSDPVLNELAKTNPSPKILVAICSCVTNVERRRAVRETWLACPVEGIECRFFIGGPARPEEPDVTAIDVNDSYDMLPAKVRAFFIEALRTSEFEWLFKCDDDTYVALDRLHELIDFQHELIGNEFIEERGSPSGGAGYLLSRRVVELLANDHSLPAKGAEDVILGSAAIRLGAAARGTSRLCWNNSRYPMHSNDTITSHWCSPEKMRMINAMFKAEFSRTVSAIHRHWKDEVILYNNGFFKRGSTSCSGQWREGNDGVIELKWFGWGPEVLVPTDDSGQIQYRAISAQEWAAKCDSKT